MVNRRTEGLLKIDWVFDMEAVHGVTAGPVPVSLLRIADKRIVEFFLEGPRVVEVVFHSGSVDGGAGALSVNEKHVISFAPPSSRKSEHIQEGSTMWHFAFRS